MLVESKKAFGHGFVLNETDLRRFVDSVETQLDKLEGKPTFKHEYEMKFRNGAIAKTNSLEEVLAQDNDGPGQIVSLTGFFLPKDDDNPTVINFSFVNADFEETFAHTAVRFRVRGQSRDWVFVTSSMLDERVAKVKRFAPIQLVRRRSVASRLFSLALIYGILVTLWLSTVQYQHISPLLEQAKEEGELTDVIDTIILVERIRDEQHKLFSHLTPASILFGMCLVLLLGAFLCWKFYPVYNFCWGDYAEQFEKTESRRKFLLGFILVGIVVSCIGGILANLLRANT